MASAITFHLVQRLASNMVSQPMWPCHNCWRDSLADMVTGDISPSGLKTVEDHLNISHLVTAKGLIVHGDSWIESIWVFQNIPSTLIGLFCSATLGWDAVVWRSKQFEDQECKLNPALLSIDRDCVKNWIAASSLSHPDTKLSTYKLFSRSTDIALAFRVRWTQQSPPYHFLVSVNVHY